MESIIKMYNHGTTFALHYFFYNYIEEKYQAFEGVLFKKFEGKLNEFC